MAKKIFTQISLFSMNHPIFLADTQGDIKLVAQPSLDDLQKEIYSIMDSTPVDEIEFDGDEKYIEAIGIDMLTNLAQKYSNNKVRIRINDKIFN